MNRRDTRALTAALHRAQSGLASIRLAVSSITAIPLTETERKALLALADEEAVRLSAQLAAISALLSCEGARSEHRALDVVELLERALLELGAGNQVRVRAPGPMFVRADPGRLSLAPVVALMRLAGGGQAPAEVLVGGVGRQLVVRLLGESPPAASDLVSELIRAMGAIRVPCEDGVALALKAAKKKAAA